MHAKHESRTPDPSHLLLAHCHDDDRVGPSELLALYAVYKPLVVKITRCVFKRFQSGDTVQVQCMHLSWQRDGEIQSGQN